MCTNNKGLISDMPHGYVLVLSYIQGADQCRNAYYVNDMGATGYLRELHQPA